MASGASVDGCFARNAVPTDRAIDGNMRPDIALFESLDKVEDVVGLVAPQRDEPTWRTLIEPC